MDLNNTKWKIKKTFELLSKGTKSYFKSSTERRNNKYYRYWRHKSLKENTILYESFYGRGMLCGPLALFNAIIDDPEYAGYKHIWVLDEPDDHKELIERCKKKYRNISFVKFGSKQYIKYLASAKYLINNVSFYGYFVKRPGQVYINTWHGIPLKHLCHDEPTGPLNAFNMTRNFLHADYVLSANPFLTEIYLDAFKMHGLATGKIIEEGYPRLDTLVNTNKEDIYDELRRSGVEVDPNKKIILYAPTWRGSSYGKPDLSVEGFEELKRKLDESIDTEKYQVLVKVHQVVYSHIKDQLAEYNYIVPATMDANVILGITDILISDYSSIYFDYLATGRPVLFYITDADSYTENRGMYFGLESLPGPYTDSLDTLGEWVNNIDDVFEQNKEKYNEIKDWCCNYSIGSISKKIVNAIFKNKWDNVNVIDPCAEKKQKVLISKGPMLVNGIGTAMLNLLKQFDYSKYDVTVIVDDTKDAAQCGKILEIDPRARVVVRQKMYIKTIFGGMRNMFYMQCGPRNALFRKIFPKKVYEMEFRRLYGESKFDYIIDYEGYNIFYASLCLAQPDARHCIWMHNDMMSEYEIRFKWLKKIFALYPQFDRLVSCSRQIMEVNREKLSAFAPADKFYFSKNSIDFEKVLSGKEDGRIVKTGDKYFYAVISGTTSVNMRLIPLQPADKTEIETGSMSVASSADKVDNGYIKFVNIGRLSPEKNQAELINAFSRFAEKHSNAMLYILGEGPLKAALQRQIDSLGLSDRIILTGNLSNPFGLLSQCDCFVLPSIHEGQPLVIFEARAIHLPIIVSDFSSVGGSLIENGQYIVHTDADSIYDGLNAFVEGRIPSDYKFDHLQYNREAYAEFENAVFGD